MKKKNRIKQVSIYFIGGFLALGILFAVSLQFPRFMTGLFFGVNTKPVELSLSGNYTPRAADAKTAAIATAAAVFIDSLNPEQKQAASYDFSDNAQRSNWSNFPEGMIPRGGLKLGTLSKEQQAKLDRLLAELMSEKGYRNLEYQLAAERTFPADHWFNKYGVDHFYVAFLGGPSASEPWMFQFGGHHLAINVTIYGADRTFSPMLTGGQPLHIHHKGQKIFITEEETAAAQALLDSLTAEQKKVAIRGKKPLDLLLGPGEYGTVVTQEGIKGSSLNNNQKQRLIDLIDTRLGFINDDDRRKKMDTVVAEIDDTYFGWWGSQGTPGFAYFRVTGPSLVIEYAPQDDAGETITNHAHSMYRNPQNDYGSAWIGKNKSGDSY